MARYILTKEEESMYRHFRRLAFPEMIKAKTRRNMRAWRARNPALSRERTKLQLRKYRKEKPYKFREYEQRRDKTRTRLLARERRKRRFANDIGYRIQHNLRSRIRMALVGKGKKAARTEALIGCTIPNLKIYLESKFESGMSWENYGEWHIDHIMPCAIFDLTRPEHQLRCFHFSNLQPLWKTDNLIKSRLVADQQFRLI